VGSGLAFSQTDDLAKTAVTIPAAANKSWNISAATSDTYTAQFISADSLDENTVNLAHKIDGNWQAITSPECIIELPWSDTMFDKKPSLITVITSGYTFSFNAISVALSP